MSLGLGHGASRHKLRFSSDKVDTMVIQAIHLLEEIDKEMNNYAMRLKEWFGWHFPEVTKIITDIFTLVKFINLIKRRENIVHHFEDYKGPLLELLGSEEVLDSVKKVADMSMGVSISDTDVIQMEELGLIITDMLLYRKDLSE